MTKPRLFAFTLTVFALAVIACAPARVIAEEAAQAQEDLPAAALDPETLYDILLGEIAGQRGQIAVAAATLSKAAQRTRYPRLAERATLAALYAKRYPEALRGAQLWVELRPKDVEAHEAMATALLELDRREEALRYFERIIALEAERNNLDQGYLRVSAALARQSNRATTIEIMRTLVRAHPSSAAAHLYMAHLAVRAGELEVAATSADEALKLQPDWEEAALFRARILISQKDPLKAQESFETFLARNPAAANIRLNYARFLVDQKQWEGAREQFKRVLADVPDDADAAFAVGMLSLQINRLDEAEKYLKRALDLRPQNDQARLYIGQVLEQQKRYREAGQWYAQVSPGEYYFETQTRIGLILAKQGDLAAARKHLQSIQPESDQQRVQLALAEEQLLREAKLHREAFEILNAAERAVPGDKDLLYARALIAEKLNLLDVAERDLREILKKDPKNVNALNALGFTLADRTTRYQEAYELLQQALALKPEDPFILDSFGWVQYRLGNQAEALKHLKRALELRNDAEISAHLGEVLWVTGNRNEAESVWNRALNLTPDSETLLGVINKFREKSKE